MFAGQPGDCKEPQPSNQVTVKIKYKLQHLPNQVRRIDARHHWWRHRRSWQCCTVRPVCPTTVRTVRRRRRWRPQRIPRWKKAPSSCFVWNGIYKFISYCTHASPAHWIHFIALWVCVCVSLSLSLSHTHTHTLTHELYMCVLTWNMVTRPVHLAYVVCCMYVVQNRMNLGEGSPTSLWNLTTWEVVGGIGSEYLV